MRNLLSRFLVWLLVASAAVAVLPLADARAQCPGCSCGWGPRGRGRGVEVNAQFNQLWPYGNFAGSYGSPQYLVPNGPFGRPWVEEYIIVPDLGLSFPIPAGRPTWPSSPSSGSWPQFGGQLQLSCPSGRCR
jgi:hypothetical protein